jgi:broad specificity phosphatase PhoE
MPTTIHLVRHGHHGLLGRLLCGRMAGVAIDQCGREEIAGCAELLQPPPSVVQSSPQLRARQSADILAARFRKTVEIAAAIDEIELGDWTARRFDELDQDPAWHCWNAQRGTARPPGGESMYELQSRVVGHIERLRSECSGETIVLVSHAEPIRAAILHYENVPLDDFLSVEIDTASVSTIIADSLRFELSQVNRKVQA